MMKQIAVPFSLVVSPFASLEPGEKEPPLADMGPSGPIRCGRCNAYMCSFMHFVDGGRRFHCPFCKTTTEVRKDYFQHLDHQGFCTDKFQRPELCLGSYEVVATREYCRDNVFPKAPAHVFIIDVSYNNIKSGLVDLLCRNMKAVLQRLPSEAQGQSPRVCFITYDKVVHFYNMKPTLAQPQMMVVSDVEVIFFLILVVLKKEINIFIVE